MNSDIDDVFVKAVEDISREPSSRKAKKGRPIGSKNFQKLAPPTDRELRSRSNKSAYIAAMKVSMDPTSYEDAISREDALWKKAMNEEISLKKNGN